MDTAEFYLQVIDKLYKQYVELCSNEKSSCLSAGYIQLISNVIRELPVLENDKDGD